MPDQSFGSCEPLGREVSPPPKTESSLHRPRQNTALTAVAARREATRKESWMLGHLGRRLRERDERANGAKKDAVKCKRDTINSPYINGAPQRNVWAPKVRIEHSIKNTCLQYSWYSKVVSDQWQVPPHPPPATNHVKSAKSGLVLA